MTWTIRKENSGNVSGRRWGVPVLVCLTLGLGACMNGQSAPPPPPPQETAPALPAAPSGSDLPEFMEAPLGAPVTVPPSAPLAGVPTPTGARVVYVPVVVPTPAEGADAARSDAAPGTVQGAASTAQSAAPGGAPVSSGVREIYVDRQASPEAAVAARPDGSASRSSVAPAAPAGTATAQAQPAPVGGMRVPAWNPQGPEAVKTEPPLAPAPRQEARVEPSVPKKIMPEGPVTTVSVPVTRTPAREVAPVAVPAAPVQAPPAPPSVPAWDPHGQPTAPASVAASTPVVPTPTPETPARASVPPAASQAASAPARSADEAAYKAALATYQAKRFEDSEQAFDAFLRQYPNSKLAPNALYWKGESLYSRKLYPEAIFVFKDVTARYPKHHKASDALLKAGMAYGRMNDEDNARLHYEVLLEDYPSSPAARRAKELRLLK